MTRKSSSVTPPAPTERWHDGDELRWAARHWAARIGVKMSLVQLRAMTAKWGSISTAGRLTLNKELLDLPRSLGEFVIVHELVHLLVPNHGRVFKSFMHAYLPDWPQRERQLQTQATHAASTTSSQKPPSRPRAKMRQLRSGVQRTPAL